MDASGSVFARSGLVEEPAIVATPVDLEALRPL